MSEKPVACKSQLEQSEVEPQLELILDERRIREYVTLFKEKDFKPIKREMKKGLG